MIEEEEGGFGLRYLGIQTAVVRHYCIVYTFNAMILKLCEKKGEKSIFMHAEVPDNILLSLFDNPKTKQPRRSKPIAVSC